MPTHEDFDKLVACAARLAKGRAQRVDLLVVVLILVALALGKLTHQR